MTRATLLLAAAILLASTGVSAGHLVGHRVAQTYTAVTYTELPQRDTSSAYSADLVSPGVVLRSGGLTAALTPAGYVAARLERSDAERLFDRLAAMAGAWADEYRLSGAQAADRVEILLVGAQARRIVVDDPFENPLVPDSLYRFLVALRRPTALGGTPEPGLPPALRVRAFPIVPDQATTKPIPLEVDLSAALDERGWQIAGADSVARFLEGGPDRRTLLYPDNGELVRAPTATFRLVWTADWSAWLREGAG